MDLQIQIAKAEVEMQIQQGQIELAASVVGQILTDIEKSDGDITLTDSVLYEKLQALNNRLEYALLTDEPLKK